MSCMCFIYKIRVPYQVSLICIVSLFQDFFHNWGVNNDMVHCYACATERRKRVTLRILFVLN